MLNQDVDTSQVEDFAKDVANLPLTAFEEMRRKFVKTGEEFLTFHLFRRLRGRPGLIQRHGQAGLAGARQTETGGSDLDSLFMAAFIGPPSNKYAVIHEKGTVGAGGTEPDIIPKTKKALAFMVDGAQVFARRVAIPPRLGWFQSWDEFNDNRDAIVTDGLKDVLTRLSKGDV